MSVVLPTPPFKLASEMIAVLRAESGTNGGLVPLTGLSQTLPSVWLIASSWADACL